jgi:hypothetical protein
MLIKLHPSGILVERVRYSRNASARGGHFWFTALKRTVLWVRIAYILHPKVYQHADDAGRRRNWCAGCRSASGVLAIS